MASRPEIPERIPIERVEVEYERASVSSKTRKPGFTRVRLLAISQTEIELATREAHTGRREAQLHAGRQGREELRERRGRSQEEDRSNLGPEATGVLRHGSDREAHRRPGGQDGLGRRAIDAAAANGAAATGRRAAGRRRAGCGRPTCAGGDGRRRAAGPGGNRPGRGRNRPGRQAARRIAPVARGARQVPGERRPGPGHRGSGGGGAGR